jgi:hypothetical protein
VCISLLSSNSVPLLLENLVCLESILIYRHLFSTYTGKGCVVRPGAGCWMSAKEHWLIMFKSPRLPIYPISYWKKEVEISIYNYRFVTFSLKFSVFSFLYFETVIVVLMGRMVRHPWILALCHYDLNSSFPATGLALKSVLLQVKPKILDHWPVQPLTHVCQIKRHGKGQRIEA